MTDYRLTEGEQKNLKVLLGALRMFRGQRRHNIAYVGMPITTGKRYYDVMSAENVRSPEELNSKLGADAFWELVMKPNIEEGTVLSDRLAANSNTLYVAPSVFNAKIWDWSQAAYMALFYNVIAEFSGRHFVADGWEYSIGALKEVWLTMLFQWRYIRPYRLTKAIEIFHLQGVFGDVRHDSSAAQGLLNEMYKLRIYDAAGEEIKIDRAMQLCIDAYIDLRERGFESKGILNMANNLMRLPILSPCMNSELTWETPLYFETRERIKLLSA